MSFGSQPAWARAFFVASRSRSEFSVPSRTQRRSRMPVRSWIHASEVSMRVASSSFVTTRSGTCVPRATKAVRGMVVPLRPPGRCRGLDVQVLDVEGVLRDELAAWLDGVAHEDREDLVRLDGVVHPHL